MSELWVPNGHERLTPQAALSHAEQRTDNPVVAEMRANRRVNARRVAAMEKSGSYGDLSLATVRPRDPMFYWRQNNLPFDFKKPEELKKLRQYCNTPDAPVWMGDYSFKPIGDIVAGDVVIGWEWYDSGRSQKSRLVRTKVLATQRRLAPEVVRITMESGRTIRCTPDHQWYNALYSPGAAIQRPGDGWTAQYRPARVGMKLRHVIDPTPELASEKERLIAAWLGGVYDGEATGERIAQDADHNPGVCQRIKDSLDALGISWVQEASGVAIRRSGPRGPIQGGSRQDLVNFLNWANPTRRQTNALDKKFLVSNFGTQDRVVSIESEGPGVVVSMQTETGNYTAWGYASKNCQMLYLTHPVIGSAIDIYAKFPLTGMEFQCEDSKITEFYTDLFFEQLNYEDFLVDVGRQYWTVGEAWPLGSFNETLGVWEDDELINPDDVEVVRSPFSRDPRFMMRLPETIRDVLSKRQPAWEYEALIRSYPELAAFASSEKALMPVSSVLLRQIRYTADPFNPRGIPLLTRGLRAVMQEEMLNAAQDAIADRLYTPLILVKLGASASDLGTDAPWIPTEADLAAFEDSLDAALAADFRVLTHHFAVEMTTVFGRENMPNLDADFERLTERQLQVFGLSKTMLSGAGRGETYAADALNRDLVSQLLTTYQRVIKRFYRDRALVVAEAQGHYEREYKGGVPYPVMEEILETDEETGEQRIVERPKLLIPELNIRAMNMSDEKEERQLMEALRASGVPISMRRRLVNVPIKLEDEEKALAEEQIRQAVAAQEVRRDTYLELRSKGLPIPEDLKADFEPRAQMPAAQSQESPGQLPLPTLGVVEPADTMALAPTPEDTAMAAQDGAGATPGAEPGAAQAPMAKVVPLRPRNINGIPSRPSESDEQRADMPKASSLDDDEDVLLKGELRGPRFRRVAMRADQPLDAQVEALRRTAPMTKG